MSFHDDLLDQAEHLAKLDLRRPKQANLRRAISSAYYALFHLLISESSGLYFVNRKLSARMSRTHRHAEMEKASRYFAIGKLPTAFQRDREPYSTPPDLKLVADAFVELQEARHKADYDLSSDFGRQEALSKVDSARQAFEAWERG